MPLGPVAAISAAVSIHCIERVARPLTASVRPGLNIADCRNDFTAALSAARISRRRISTSNSRSRGGSSARPGSMPSSTARSTSRM
jgi:hypothetical protein